MEQPENSYYWPPGSAIPSFSPSTQESGTAVAHPTPRCTPPDTPTRIQLQLQPPPVRQLPLTESDEITSMEDTLRKILKAQNELKQQMNGIMIRVDKIEHQAGIEVADSSLSSSSTSTPDD